MKYLFLFLAVAIGYVIALFFQKKEIKQLSFFLSFSGAFLLSITLFEMLPEVFENDAENVGVLIMGGILLQIILDFFSKGAEHGHVHLHSETKSFPWPLFLSLSIHAILEGFPAAENIDMLWAIIIHKIPIAIILSMFFIKAGYSKAITAMFIFTFGLMTPIGTLISEKIIILNNYETEINAVVIGILLHVSTTILFEDSKDHKFNFIKLLSIFLGIIVAYFL